MIETNCNLGRLLLNNGVVAASGTVAYGREVASYVDVSKFGALITKSIMKHPRAGGPTPRIAETSSGMLNAIGLQGGGIDEFLQEHLPWIHATGACIGVSIAGESISEFAENAARVAASGLASFIELNISCPNVASRDLVFATDPTTSEAVVRAVKLEIGQEIPLLAKLSPDVTSITAIAGVCIDAGVDGLSLINTFLGMAISPRTLKPVLANKTGGLSGPAIFPLALRAVWQVHHAFPDIPILGGGGVTTGLDAASLMAVGASAVSVGTANFADPSACIRIAVELSEVAASQNLNVRDLVGIAHEIK